MLDGLQYFFQKSNHACSWQTFLFMFAFVSELGSCIAVILTKMIVNISLDFFYCARLASDAHDHSLDFFLLFFISVWKYQKDPGNSCAVLSTSRFDLLHGTFAVFLCQTPLIRTVLKRAPPSLLRVCRHIWRNQTRPEKDWLNTLHRPAADRHARGLWSEARYERLTPSGGIIRWLSGILNWADWVVGETLGPPETRRGHCLAMNCNKLRIHQTPRKLCCRYELGASSLFFFFFASSLWWWATGSLNCASTESQRLGAGAVDGSASSQGCFCRHQLNTGWSCWHLGLFTSLLSLWQGLPTGLSYFGQHYLRGIICYWLRR